MTITETSLLEKAKLVLPEFSYHCESEQELMVRMLVELMPEKGYRDSWVNMISIAIDWVQSVDNSLFQDVEADPAGYDNCVGDDTEYDIFIKTPAHVLQSVLKAKVDEKYDAIKKRVVELYQIFVGIFGYDELWSNIDLLINDLEQDQPYPELIKQLLPELRSITIALK